jgi:hypothetical protein
MINLTKGLTQDIYFTGSEKITLTNPYFLFIFTNRITSEVVKFMATNISTTLRYDKFSLVVNTYFSTSTTGFYDYEIREKASISDLAVTGTIVESGYAYLNPSTAFTPTIYTGQSNTVTVYNGE